MAERRFRVMGSDAHLLVVGGADDAAGEAVEARADESLLDHAEKRLEQRARLLFVDLVLAPHHLVDHRIHPRDAMPQPLHIHQPHAARGSPRGGLLHT